jgi:recombination protein RecT
MGNNQQLTTQETGTKAVSQFLNQKNVLEKFSELLGDRASAFITSVISAVNANQLLQNATQVSIYNAALSAAAMNLPINNNLGFAYIVPYENSYKDSQGKWIKKIEAQCQKKKYSRWSSR